MAEVTVVIPTYKRLAQFSEYFSHNAPYLQGCAYIIVNDDPDVVLPRDMQSSSIADLPITWINHTQNVGFAHTVNDGVAQAKSEYIMLLNTDVKLLDDRWRLALTHMQHNPQVFALSFAQIEKNGAYVGRNSMYFSQGLYQHKALEFSVSDTKNPHLLLSTAWAEGGACVLRKSMWDLLGGFDPAFSPFYWEDVDLSYRAKQRGWGVYFYPHIMVEHHHESTIGSTYDQRSIHAIAFKNQQYFTHKHAQGLQAVLYRLYLHIIEPLRDLLRNQKRGHISGHQ